MIKKVPGYILTVIGFLGIGYFKYYNGQLIPYSLLWFFISVAIFLLGSVLLMYQRSPKNEKAFRLEQARLKLLKENGEKIVLDIAHCSFRSNNFIKEVEPGTSIDVQMGDGLYDANHGYTTEAILQTVIEYRYGAGDNIKIYTSQVFAIDETTLQFYIMNHLICLYIDRVDKHDYYFEIN